MFDMSAENGHFSSHDHILRIQELTGGRILAAPGKECTLQEMWFYTERSERPAYFINCVFPLMIFNREKRDNQFSAKPGFRFDLLLDFEKKKMVKDEWVKNESISTEEKQQSIAVLESIPQVGWAGMTPHGVHAGLYFTDWIPNDWSGQVVKWVGAQIARAGYQGTVAIDWSPSVNCNRPSRFLSDFSFWRPEARLDASSAIKEEVAASEHAKSKNKYLAAGSGSMQVQAKRGSALRCRTDGMSAAETAATLGETTAWVEQVWSEVPQEKFRPFNWDLRRIVGPRSRWGYRRQCKFKVFNNAAWSWEWCWSRRMDSKTARDVVFTVPIFEEVLKEIRNAWEQCVRLNKKGSKITATWEEWVEKDIARCYVKFGRGYLRKQTVRRHQLKE